MDRRLSAAPTTPTWATSSRKFSHSQEWVTRPWISLFFFLSWGLNQERRCGWPRFLRPKSPFHPLCCCWTIQLIYSVRRWSAGVSHKGSVTAIETSIIDHRFKPRGQNSNCLQCFGLWEETLRKRDVDKERTRSLQPEMARTRPQTHDLLSLFHHVPSLYLILSQKSLKFNKRICFFVSDTMSTL